MSKTIRLKGVQAHCCNVIIFIFNTLFPDDVKIFLFIFINDLGNGLSTLWCQHLHKPVNNCWLNSMKKQFNQNTNGFLSKMYIQIMPALNGSMDPGWKDMLTVNIHVKIDLSHFSGSVRDYGDSNAIAMELPHSCSKPTIYPVNHWEGSEDQIIINMSVYICDV